MKPQCNVTLCRPCVMYHRSFMRVTPRKGVASLRLKSCDSCGRFGLHWTYDLESRKQTFPFLETCEGWALAARCASDVWRNASRAYYEQPYEVQREFSCAPRSDEEFRVRLQIWKRILGNHCTPEDTDACCQALSQWWEEIRARQL